MIRMCVYLHSRFIKNHPIRIRKDGTLISEGFYHTVYVQYTVYTILFFSSPITSQTFPFESRPSCR
jgi:hypothetical protein